ncbi:three component ABC system middle component [Amycolatopsis sp. NPDC001319]|uniref:three component ABC system middle component n=1 Tax=unclassified Amycolatopsis TaxID=2618356 RepID=UPI0036A65059
MLAPESHSPEALALFNPAITGAALGYAVESYQGANIDGLPFFFSFLILPFTLNPELRKSVGASSRRTLASWSVSNPALHAQYPHIAEILVPTTRRALRYCLRYDLLEVRNASLHVKRRLRRVNRSHPDELREIVSAARTCGKWFASTDIVTAFSLLGVKP